MIYYHHYNNVFIRTRTCFFSGVEDDDLESFFSYGISFWNIEWNSGEILEWKQLTPVQTFQLLSNCYFFEEKKIYFLWMHGDWPIKRQWGLRSRLYSPVEHFVTLKWSNVKIYYSYYYKYIYKKRNHFYLWILQGRIGFVNKVLSHVCTYLVLIRKWSLCWSFSVSHSLMVQYEKRYEKYMKTIALYCTVMMKNNYVVSILTGPVTLQLCIQV